MTLNSLYLNMNHPTFLPEARSRCEAQKTELEKKECEQREVKLNVNMNQRAAFFNRMKCSFNSVSNRVIHIHTKNSGSLPMAQDLSQRSVVEDGATEIQHQTG